MCLFWVGFADWIAPNIIAAAYDERSLSILNWVFQGRRSFFPVEHYLDRWSMYAAAVLLAAVLHFVIVLFICGIDRKHRVRFLDAARPYSHANVALVVYSAAFLALAVLSGAQGDYAGYLDQWMAVLRGDDPWGNWGSDAFNAYGPLFNMLAPLAWVNPLANKLLFAFSYLVFVIWLIKDFAPRQGFVALSWPWVGLWLQPVSLAANCVLRILRRSGVARLRRGGPQPDRQKGWRFRDLSGVGNITEIHADRHFAISRVQ